MTSALNHRYPAIQGELEDEFESEWEDEHEYGMPGGRSEFEAEAEAEYESEAEFDFESEAEGMAEGESEDEGEDFVNPVRRIYPDAELMAHLSAQAARADSETEAEAFIGALVPLAARLVPRAARLIARHTPTLIRGVTRVAGQLRRNPTGRKLVAAVPVILQRTVQSLGDQAAAGRQPDADTVVRTLTTMAERVLGAPQSRARAVRAVRTFDRRYHQRQRRQARSMSVGRSSYRGTARRGRRRR